MTQQIVFNAFADSAIQGHRPAANLSSARLALRSLNIRSHAQCFLPRLTPPQRYARNTGQKRSVTLHVSPLECAPTSHFAPESDLKSFRMRTYVTQGEGGWVPQNNVNSLILKPISDHPLVLVPGNVNGSRGSILQERR